MTVDLDALVRAHPAIGHYRDGGMGGVGENHSVIGWVPTVLLLTMRGNAAWHEDRVQHWVDETEAGRGFAAPVLIEFNPDTRYACVSEGNHRVAAAARTGLTHVPARCIRSYFRLGYFEGKGGTPVRLDVTSCWTTLGPDGVEEYWPSDFNPCYLLAGVVVPGRD